MEIFSKTSVDNGTTWSAAKRLTNNAGDSLYPSVAVDGSNVHVAWRDNTPGNNEIYLRSSSDNGATWAGAKRITNNSGNSAGQSVAASGPYVYVTWLDNTTGNSEIYVKTSSDNGATWSAATRLTTNRVTDISGSWVPAVAVSGSRAYVAWNDGAPGNSEIYLKTSADNGATWSAAKRLTNNAGFSSEPSIAVSGSNIYVAWRDNTPGNDEIYFKTSADNGAAWSAPKRLTNNAGGSYEPYVSASGSNVYVAWMDNTPGNFEIYLRTSADNGAAWSAPKKLTNNAGDSGKPSVAASGSNVYLTWHDSTPGNYEIYTKTSVDNGATWSTARRLTSNAGYSYAPSLAAAPLISGTWAYQLIRHNASGWYVELSKVTFNSDGTGSITGSWNNNGTLYSGITNPFTYTAAANTDGSINITSNIAGDISTGKYVISDDGNMMVTDGTTFAGSQRLMTLVRLDTSKSYSNADFSGQYLGGGYEYYVPGSSYRTRSFFDTSNGAGTYTVNATLNQSGTIVTQSGPTTYSVDAGGKAVILNGPDFMLSGNGKLAVYSTTDNAVDYESGLAMKQDKAYSTANIAGKWAIASFGDDDGTSFVASIGTMVCDAAGSCSLSMKSQRNGTVSYEAATIGFMISSDGTFGNSLSAGSPAYAGAIGNGGNTVIFNVSFIETDPKYPNHRQVFMGIRCSSCSNLEGL